MSLDALLDQVQQEVNEHRLLDILTVLDARLEAHSECREYIDYKKYFDLKSWFIELKKKKSRVYNGAYDHHRGFNLNEWWNTFYEVGNHIRNIEFHNSRFRSSFKRQYRQTR